MTNHARLRVAFQGPRRRIATPSALGRDGRSRSALEQAPNPYSGPNTRLRVAGMP